MSGRLLAIFVFTVLAIVGTFGLRLGLPLYRQRLAIDEIERLGGSVIQTSSVPSWIRDLFGEEQTDWMNEITEIDLHDTEATDSTLALLVDMQRLEEIDLDGTKITDAGIARLSNTVNLKTISLSRTPVSDAALEAFSRMEKLQMLYLANTKVTDHGIANLKKSLPRIEIWKLAEREREIWPWVQILPPTPGMFRREKTK